MATPQTGSQRVPSALSFLSRDAFALRPHGAFVASIQRTLTDRLFLLEEGSAPSKQYRIPTWAILGSSDFWVDQLSAQVGLPSSLLNSRPIRGSHANRQPSNKQRSTVMIIYRKIRRILIRYSASTDGQQHKEELKVTARLPASRIPAVGIFLDRQETIVRNMKLR